MRAINVSVVVAVASLVVGFLIGILLFPENDQPNTGHMGSGDELIRRIASVEAELTKLRQCIADSGRKVGEVRERGISGGQEGDRAQKLTDRDTEVKGRLEKIEQWLGEIYQEHQRVRSERERRTRLLNRRIADLRQVVMNPSKTPDERIRALRQLRDVGLPEVSRDARDHVVVLAMIKMAESSTDSAVRADVFKGLAGIADPAAKDLLLNALATDPSNRVRYNAAITLAGFVADPVVQEALRNATQNDESMMVRAYAHQSLHSLQRK